MKTLLILIAVAFVGWVMYSGRKHKEENDRIYDYEDRYRRPKK